MDDPTVILVTGATGFLGSALCSRLAHAYPSARIRAFSSRGGPAVDAVDIANPTGVEDQVRGADWVFHLAAFTRVPDILADPATGVSANIVGTANVLDACRRHDVQRVILLSTGRVLGSPDCLPATEDLPLAPAEPYGAQKAAAELLGRAYHRAYGLNVTVVRPAIVYGRGRRMTAGSMSGVVPRFASALLAGHPVTLVGDGLQRSDFIHVDDVMDGLLAVAAAESVAGEVFHFGSGRGTSIRDLLDLMAELAEVQPLVEHLPPSSETVDLFLSGVKAERVLGFIPRVTLRTGLSDYFTWLREGGADDGK